LEFTSRTHVLLKEVFNARVLSN